MTDPVFLPGVPADAVLAALGRSPGGEIASGKFASPESSAALVANTFGWFLNRPSQLPALPGVPMGPVQTVAIEAEMRFPWSGGRQPWLDAEITTATTLVGVESKRYEPFRPGKAAEFSEAFDRRDWGAGMARYTGLRKALAAGQLTYRHLDAAQLVKHAYGLKTQAVKRGLGGVLVYLHAAPALWASGKPVDPKAISRHATEIADFAARVKGDDVTFVPLRWGELLNQWSQTPATAAHAAAVRGWFGGL
jgi:hypothetical protein